MHDTLNPYPAYTPSGVPWLGDVPAHWEVRRLKRIVSLNPSRAEARSSLTDDTRVTFLPMESVGTDGKIEAGETLLVSDVQNGLTYFRRGDVLVAKITPCFENGKGTCLDSLPTEVGFGSTEFHVLRAGSSLAPQFLYRLTTLPEFRQLGVNAMTGAAGQQRVPQAFIENYSVALPPPAEQTAIVRYLDHADRLIRRYVGGKEKLIGLLEEQRQAVVQRAVTRGLDPAVRLKPSGVAWLGDVPVHWEVRRLQHVADMKVSNVDKHIKEGELSVRLCNYVDVYKNHRITEDIAFMHATATEEEVQKFRLEPGDVLITKDSETWNDIGVPALAEFSANDLICGYHLALLRPLKELLDGAYLFRTLQSPAIAHQFHVSANGITRYGLSQYGIKTAILPIPPLPEQTAIVEYLDKATADIDTAVARARREIDLLREYRTRLIADVVTGKVDVRAAVAGLREEVDETKPGDQIVRGPKK